MGKIYTTHTISIGDHNLDAPVMVQINALIADGLHSEAGYLTEESGTTRLTDAEIAAMGYIKTYTDTDTNTQLSDAQIAEMGYIKTYTDTDTNTQLTDAEIAGMGYIKTYTDTDTNTQLTSAQIAAMGYTGDQTAAQIQSLGMARFYNNAVLNSSATTATFIAELISDYGCFANNQVTLKVQWSYAGSSDLVTDHATIGTIELAGCTIETWGGSYKHIRISRPNTGTGGHMVVEYNDQSASYAPGWREIWTSESDGAGSGLDADLLDGQQGDYYYPASNPNNYITTDTNTQLTSAQIAAMGYASSGFDSVADLSAPNTTVGTWNTATTVDWGTPRIGSSVGRYIDNAGSLSFAVPAGMKTAYISQLTWSSGGYADVYGIQADGDAIFLRRINTKQNVENSNHGNPNQHDGSTIAFAGHIGDYPTIRISNKSGRLHLTGLGFSKSEVSASDGTGIVNYSQLTGTAPTWNQNTTGNATTATTANTATLASRVSINSDFSGTYPMLVEVESSGTIYNNPSVTYNGASDTLTSPNFAGNLTGNASSATIAAAYLPLSGGTLTGDITVGSGNTSSNIYMADSDGTQRRIHTNSNRIGFLTSGDGWGSYCDNSGNWYSDHSMRAPIFYDSNDTNYFLDPASSSVLFSVSAQHFYGNLTGNASTATTAAKAYHLPTAYVGGVQNNPQTYFSTAVGLKSAMTGYWGVWSDTLWINGYSGSDVRNMVAIHTKRNGQPKIGISTQSCAATSYGTVYELISTWSDTQTKAGVLQSNASLRAPIFYDSNDTSYYVDPASTSRLNGLTVNGSLDMTDDSISIDNQKGFSNSGSWTRNQTPYGYIDFGPANTGHAHIYTDRTNFYFNKYLQVSGGSRINTSDIRAKIFYDIDNTGYYVDAASTTQLNHLSVNSTFKSRNFGTAGMGYQLENRDAGGATFRFDGDTFIFYGAGGVGNVFEMNQSGYAQASSSLRAPIFYDSDDTNYYVNPNTTTTAINVKGAIKVLSSHSGGNIELDYPYSGNATYAGNMVMFMSEPGVTHDGGGIGCNIATNSPYYGRKYNHGYGVYLRFDKTSGHFEFWNTQSTAGNSSGRGTRRFYGDASGNTWSSASSRAPIFYDTNNTGYYLNPASTSNLNVLTLAGTATASNFILSSDERKKTKIKDLTRNNINTNWKSFEMKNDEGEYRTGVIAQELEETHPEFVNTDSEGFKSVKYIDLLIAKIAELEARLEKLEK